MIFLAVFIIIPILEIALFIEVGGALGVGWTLFMCFLTAVLGAALIRIQGLGALLSARRRMDRNEMPMVEMMDGIALAFAGACLITPGFFTDAIGFTLLVPPLRHYIQREILRRFGAHVFTVGGAGDFHNAGRQSPYNRRESEDIIIDVEYERMDDEDNKDNAQRKKLNNDRDDTP